MRIPFSYNCCHRFLARVGLLLVLALVCFRAQGQSKVTDTANKVDIIIVSTRTFIGIETDSATITKLIDSVQLRQGETLMFCDSTYLNVASNNLEAFGNVRIIQPGGTEVNSDYLRYIGNKKLAYLRGNVSLTDGKNTLWSEDLTYDVGTKIATYENGGTLQSNETTVSSNAGTYNVRSKDARFRGEVYITDPQYNVESEDLGYNTGSEVVTFFGPSVVTNDRSVLHTKCGTYDTKKEIAHFTCRSSILSEDQYIEADRIDYNRITGFGEARGKVIAIDTAQHTTMWSGYASYHERKRTLFSTMKPVLLQANGRDSLYIAADTFYSAPDLGPRVAADVPRKADTVSKKNRKGKNPKSEIRNPQSQIATAPDLPVDTSAPRFYIGYRHVRIWSDSLQGRCDSISYSQKDSVMKLMKDPVAWSRRSQITGDTILLYTDTGSKIKRLYVPNNALVVSQSGPVKAQFFDQIQGKTLTGYFRNNTITHMIVFPNAESVYFAKDDKGAYLGINQAESERMKVLFRDETVYRILLEQEVKQTMTPLTKSAWGATHLSRFKWLERERPKSREELFK